jgi:hypothetical protein
MARCLLVVFLVALVSAAAGCGGGGESLSDAQIATQSLIGATDLPSEMTGEEDGLPAEPCGPALIFESNGGRADETDLFAFGNERVQEAVGVFAETPAADSAYEELTGAEHYKCIQGSIAEFNAGEEAVEPQPVRSLGLGDRDALERFLLVGAGTQTPGYTDLEAIQSGRCLASVIVLSEERTPDDAAITELSTTALEALEDTCG